MIRYNDFHIQNSYDLYKLIISQDEIQGKLERTANVKNLRFVIACQQKNMINNY